MTRATRQNQGHEEKLFHGWRIVWAGALISAVGSGLVVQGFSAYAVLLREEFGWSTGILALAFAVNRLADPFSTSQGNAPIQELEKGNRETVVVIARDHVSRIVDAHVFAARAQLQE